MAHALALPLSVRLWLLIMALMVAMMVGVGGYTRLTESGLSITYWKPIHGVIPPRGEAEWQEEFQLYQQTPEFQQVNKQMDLAGFKQIYWVEYAHRMLGRLLGLVFFLPMLAFLILGKLRGPVCWHVLGLMTLGGLQGFFGWYMVKSGLIDRPDVSHYRLTLHLVTAFALYAWLIGLFLFGRPLEPKILSVGTIQRLHFLKSALKFFGLLLFGQLVLGGFVAGLNAGLAYNTFPLMDGQFIPPGMDTLSPWVLNLFENTITIQFAHRWWAFAVLAMAVLLWWQAGRVGILPAAGRAAARLAGVVGLQILLGIWTLLAVVPISLGVLHQVTALAVLTAWMAFLMVVARNLKANQLHLRGSGPIVGQRVETVLPAGGKQGA